MVTRPVTIPQEVLAASFGKEKAELVEKFNGLCFLCEENSEELGVVAVCVAREHPKFLRILFMGTSYMNEEDRYLNRLILSNMIDSIEEQMIPEGYWGIIGKTFEKPEFFLNNMEIFEQNFFVQTSREANIYFYNLKELMKNTNLGVVEKNWDKFAPYVMKLERDDILLKKLKGKKKKTGYDFEMREYAPDISRFFVSDNEVKTALMGKRISSSTVFYPTVYMEDGEVGSKLIPALMYDSFRSIADKFPEVTTIAIEGFSDNVVKGMETFLGVPYDSFKSRELLRLFDGVDIETALDEYLEG